MRILALDLGTHTGWATFYEQTRHSGVEVFDLRRGESPGMRFLRFHRWLVDLPRPELVVFEQAHHRGGAATSVAIGFESHLLSFCAQYGIEHQPIHSSTLKKWAAGKGNADKDAMVEAVCRRFCPKYGVEVHEHDDNEMDAIALLEKAREELVTA